jgi:hypothetical protein
MRVTRTGRAEVENSDGAAGQTAYLLANDNAIPRLCQRLRLARCAACPPSVGTPWRAVPAAPVLSYHQNVPRAPFTFAPAPATLDHAAGDCFAPQIHSPIDSRWRCSDRLLGPRNGSSRLRSRERRRRRLRPHRLPSRLRPLALLPTRTQKSPTHRNSRCNPARLVDAQSCTQRCGRRQRRLSHLLLRRIHSGHRRADQLLPAVAPSHRANFHFPSRRIPRPPLISPRTPSTRSRGTGTRACGQPASVGCRLSDYSRAAEFPSPIRSRIAPYASWISIPLHKKKKAGRSPPFPPRCSTFLLRHSVSRDLCSVRLSSEIHFRYAVVGHHHR